MHPFVSALSMSALCLSGHQVALGLAFGLMRWEKEGPLGAQLPISASIVGRYDVVVGGDVGIDWLVTDLEDAPDAAADGYSPAIIVISLPVGLMRGLVVRYQPLGRL
jgi:hypothetical protein